MPSKILKFSKDRLITGINIVDGMLFFTDNHTEPKKINIEKFKGNDPEVPVDHSTGTTSIYGRPFAEADITVIKGHPKHALDTDLTRDSEISDDGGDDIIIDLDPSPTPSTFVIKTKLPRGVSLNRIIVEGENIFGNKNVIEQGFYYTFSDSFGDPNDRSDINDLIANVGNGSVHKIHTDSPSAGTYDIIIPTATAITQGAVAGSYISYIAYCIVEGDAGQSEYYFASTKRSYQLTDQTQTPTGSIDDLELSILKSSELFGTTRTDMVATFTNTTNLNVRDQPKGFFISKAYREIDNPTTPSYSVIENQATDRDPASDALFPASYVNPAAITANFNENKFYLSGGIDFSRLNTGDLYFAFAFIETSAGNYLRSPIEKMVVSTDIVSTEGPSIRHVNTNAQAAVVDFTGNVYRAGADATLVERGYIFSTEVDNIAIVNRIFNDFNTSGSYEYNGAEPINNTFKVPVVIPDGKTGEESSGDGSGEFTVSTENYLTGLSEGTTIYYIAYAVNSRGQRTYTDIPQFSITTGESYVLNEGEMFFVTTKTNDVPKIKAGIGINNYKQLFSPSRVELVFKFKIHGGIADPTKVSSVGIQYAYATGRDLTYGVNYDNLVSFAGDGEYEKIEGAPTNKNIDVSQFNYTGEDPNELVGNFVIKDDAVVLKNDVFNSAEDYALMTEVQTARGDDYIEAMAYTYNGPSLGTLSYFAYIVYDGITYKSNISSGWWVLNTLFTINPWTPRTCATLTFYNPSIFSGGRDANKKVEPPKPPPGGMATIFGAICPDAPHGNTVGGSMSELGFYWSYTPIPDTTDATTGKLIQWTELSSTHKVPATAGGASGPNVTDPTNPVNTSTAAKSWHVNRSDDERSHFEFSATIGPFIGGATKVYWVPYLKPRPRREINMIPILAQNAPEIVFGTTNDLLNSFDIGSPLTAIDIPPTIKIDSINALSNGVLSFVGSADPGSGNYDITRKGFYVKPISAFSNPNDAASVKAEMASPANGRQTFDTANFNPNAPYGISSTFAPGTYVASAFCTVVLPDANGVDQTHIRISDNNRQRTLGSPPPANEDTTPVVTNTGEGNLMRGQVDAKGVALTSKGFYVLEVKGTFHNNTNLSKPSTGSALKTIFDNPPANVTAINVPGSTVDGSDSIRFRAAIPNQKQGYVYYYAAYAANSSEEGISSSVKFEEYLDEFEKFIEISPIPFNNTIKCNNKGQVKLTNSEAFFGNSVSIKVETELQSLDNFNFRLSSWSSGGRITSVNKRTSLNGNFIDINLVGTNFSAFPRECTLRIYHATDNTKVTVLSIIQDGNSDTGDEFINPLDILWDAERDDDREDYYPGDYGPLI